MQNLHIKYLRTFGFKVNDDVFAENSWYFRNALVRANYNNFEKNIFEDTIFLEKFFANLISDTKYELKNRYTYIDYKQEKNKYIIEEQVIINIINDNENIKQEEIAKLTGKSIRTIKTIMRQMQEKKIIRRVGGKKNCKWVIL